MNNTGRDATAKLAVLGTLLGLGVALSQLLELPPTAPNAGVATVNGVAISAADLDRAAAAVAGGSPQRHASVDRGFLLDRLVDEELLVQRAIELGLASADPSVRKSLVAAMIDSVTAAAGSAPVGEDALRAYFEMHSEGFTSQPRLRVARYSYPSRGEAERARGRLLAGEVPRSGRDPHLPETLLSPTKLREYVGPSAAAAVSAVALSTATPVLFSAGRYHVMVVDERIDGARLSFEQARDALVDAVHRERAEAALRAYLEQLRERAEVSLRVASR